MKGFVACAIRAACLATTRPLAQPLRLSLSCDEEIGCVGVRSLLGALTAETVRPSLCIVGEPTSLRIANGHKGKIALEAVFTGSGGHSALAPRLVSAVHMATDFVMRLRERQAGIIATGAKDADYEIPYSTLHVGRIEGGEALNIVPARCMVAFEMRLLPEQDGDALLAAIRADAEAIALGERVRFAGAAAEIMVQNRYPGLDTPAVGAAVSFVTGLLGTNERIKVDFGTEAGLFDSLLGTPTVVCGPGSMDQGHKADEYIEVEQMARCDRMLGVLLDRLCD
jgi:acetylornithine deacetylase